MEEKEGGGRVKLLQLPEVIPSLMKCNQEKREGLFKTRGYA